MAKILPVSEKLSWYLTRSSGTVAYLALSLSTVWGLLLSTKVIKEWVPASLTLAMHNSLAWITVGLSFFHAFVLLFDSYYTYTVANLLIPFTGPYAPLWVGIGTVNFYLLLLISASFYMRSRIGTKNWRRLHYLTFAAFLFVTLHGWMAGTDSTQLKPMYLVSGMLVLFLTIYRILDAIQHSHRQLPRHHSPRPVQS
ncbi:MAG: ferric reductase-like transmembrane domain-containing protein [Caldilineaceae bacterium]|nr:ferric reductase-like transmembrane domain-containing protein [Caldilineaceae bacterium]MCB0124779.1 ferric reductase-like transmembrane domain-containing protein [Caldilineaceae bacterium]